MALTKVTNTGIADDAVTTDKIEDGTVVAADIAPGTIANAKLANSSITVNGSSVSLGGSANLKHIDWQALTVADGSTTLNAEAGKGYFLDTNAGVIEVFLPSSPTRGDTVVLADYSGTFGTNQIIINTGGELLDSTAGNDFKVTTNNSIVELIYVDSAKGWLVKLNQAAGTTPSSVLDGGVYDIDTSYIVATGGTITTVDTDYKVHTFTGDGCFVVSAGAGPLATVDYLVIAGGGSGGTNKGGGGGAGGYRESSGTASGCYTASPLGACVSGITVSATTYPVTVGGGGAGGSYPTYNDGSNSIFSTITSAGGGAGGDGPLGEGSGTPGGSGGGGIGGFGGNPCGAAGGTGNTPPVSPPQGNNGGTGTPGAGSDDAGGGGGGASANGTNGNPGSGPGGNGGNGVTSSINGSPTTRAGGGGGAVRRGDGQPTGRTPGTGGSGGGGTGGGQPNPAVAGTSGSTNTGSGGGGGGPSSGSGGSGLVIIRYKFQ